MLSIFTWILLFAKYLGADDNSGYIEKCIDHPEDNGEPLDEIELEQGRVVQGNICKVYPEDDFPTEDPEFWDIYCDTVDDCPSDWLCERRFNICYAPSYIPSYFKDLAPADPRKVVDFKQR